MAIALITAGGIGTRTGNKVPKQFITINDIPLIVYTMINVEKSNCYDGMYVICSDGWRDFVTSYASQYGISIFKGTISGGNSRFDSYYNGLKDLYGKCSHAEIISILDGNRPMTSKYIFERSIVAIKDGDCVLPLDKCYDSMYNADLTNRQVVKTINRELLYRGQSPETCVLETAYNICLKEKQSAPEEDLTLTMIMLKNNKKVLFVEGSSLNFKITTNEDFALFKALCPIFEKNNRKNSSVLGSICT